MPRLTLIVLTLLAAATSAAAQQQPTRTRNVVLIVADGVRWQEVFRGADPALIQATQGVEDTARLSRDFARPDTPDARRTLMPFLWDEIARNGQIIGDSALGSNAHVTNGLKFSYPGYNEMLTGAPDSRIDRNDYGPNLNTTVFEWLNQQPGFEGRVAAYGTWGAFREIFARERTGLWVRAGWEDAFPSPRNDRERELNDLYATFVRYWDNNTFDALAHASVLEYLREYRPRVLFVGYGEPDEWAHGRRYDLYLRSIHRVDAAIAELWTAMEAIPEYRGSTTFIITADHGRGRGDDWTDHGRDIDGAERVWMAVIGPDTPATGVRSGEEVTQSQIAATIAALLGQDFGAVAPDAAPPIAGVIGH
jgi:hypothetical protein